MGRTSSQPSINRAMDTGGHSVHGSSGDPSAPLRLEQIPKAVGVLLLAAGMVTGMLPPPPGPFDISLMLAGGVTLWPRGLQTVEGWSRRRFPKAHRAGMSFLERFLDDLERRYPGSTGC
ncbi:MAG TPA: hypothetical protein VKA15_21805 [Isosphaeraceae bacterium]|nr:hypothetical protein [Isosphaeraceae bacterium]